MKQGKAVVFSAPSGSGKTTIVHHLLDKIPELGFSISATTREKRTGENHGIDYYFLSPEDFQKKIESGAFVEWEQVYEGLYYGTLKSELERLWRNGRHVIFDVDVKGGLNIKKALGKRCLAVFVKAPSVDVIEQRLRSRDTENEEKIIARVEKAEYEMGFEDQFDLSIVNDNLKSALHQAEKMVGEFLTKQN